MWKSKLFEVKRGFPQGFFFFFCNLFPLRSLSLSLSLITFFDLIYNMSGFELFCWKLNFSRRMVNLNCALFFMHNNPGLEIEKRDHLQSCFDTFKLIATSDFPKSHPFKIVFFKVMLQTLFLVKNWFLYFWDSI